ncbi:DUF5317 family protein [Fusibacter bizertensis]|uniref:DUF5317 family protein n=1 Tax=Fusibacter bizertensis TaxID=1488331 RepID=A0ABT6NDX9_9FIRM|nr:DUF5317 family protein [Fusibacter bizertensis]MDH8678613.1 DUF5317 family protein [Fusibacter bizertensis]
MYIEAILLGLIIGLARNGRLTNFFEVRFKGWGLSILAFLLFLVPYGLKLLDISYDKLQIFPFAAMVICALIALMNFEKTGMKILLVGILLNLIAMGFNDFKMPMDTVKMASLGFNSFVESMNNGDVVNYMPLSQAEGFSKYLGKIIALPKAYPLAKVLSIGDFIVSIGIAFIIQYEMLLSSLKSRGSMLRFTYNSKIRR